MIYVRSVERSVEFYRKLGFVVASTHLPDGRVEPVWAWLESGGAHLMLARASEGVDPEKQGALFYLYCADVAAFRNLLIEAGVEAGRLRIRSTLPGASSASPISTDTS